MVKPIFLFVAGMIGMVGPLVPAVRAQLRPGDRFPAVTDVGLDSTAPSFAGHVVIVDFWASWCAPCKASFPAYTKLQADYAAQGLVVVAVSEDDDPAAYAAFVSRMKPGFFVTRDARHGLAEKVSVPTMPTSYVIDRSGKIRHVNAAFHGDRTERQIRSQIQSLLAESDK
jgi:thiol-disulfide isomerase/thioredoxin